MTQTSDRIPVVAPANNVPGPKQGFWTYDDIVPGFMIHVEQFFVSAWE